MNTDELRLLKRKNMLNKIFLGLFLVIAIIGFILKVIDGVLLDFGYKIDKSMLIVDPTYSHNGTFHPSFWTDPKIVNIVSDPTNYDPKTHRSLLKFAPIIAMVKHHPSSVWLLTQFTWLTTIIIMFFLIFRFFKYDSILPKWLKWITTQRTLSLITMYDIIIGIVFWVAIFRFFDRAFNPDLKQLERTITVIVHAIIPILMVSYSMIYLLKDKNASTLKEMFILKGMIYPTIYVAYYLMLTGIWSDPYAITNMHNSLIVIPGDGTLSGHSWVSELWKAPVGLIGIWIFLQGLILFHNFVLHKWNKLYNPKKDYELLQRKKYKHEKLEHKKIRKNKHL